MIALLAASAVLSCGAAGAAVWATVVVRHREARQWEVLWLLTRRLDAQEARVREVAVDPVHSEPRRPSEAAASRDEQTLAEAFARISTHRGGRLTPEEAADLIRADRDAR